MKQQLMPQGRLVELDTGLLSSNFAAKVIVLCN